MSFFINLVSTILRAKFGLNIESCLIFFVIFLISWFYMINKKTMPPGPWGYPLFGYLPFLSEAMHESLNKLSKQYGPILQISLGVKKVVILSDPDVIRQTFRREEFTGKPVNKLYEMFQGYGVINIAGDRWKEQRRFLHEHLRALGMKLFGPGRENMERRITTEVGNLLKSLASHEGKATSVDTYLKNASANVVCSIMMSVTFENDNPIFVRFMELHKQGFQLFLGADIANYVPLFKYSPKVKACINQLKNNRNESLSMLKNIVNERRKNFDPLLTRDIIDAYLQKEHSEKLEGKDTSEFYDCQILQVMSDLFSAGQETANLLLNWSLLYLVHNKDVVSKVQEELDSVVGRNRLPSLDDMLSLPYTEATLREVLRKANIVPMATPHTATQDTYIGDYFISSGTTVFSNLYSCHMDPETWPNPEKFDPTRFLNEEGKLIKPKAFMPFGVGRRMCLGEVLAKSEIFLFISSILHVFNLESANKYLPSLRGKHGVSSSPAEAYEMRFIQRDTSLLLNDSIQQFHSMAKKQEDYKNIVRETRPTHA